MKNSKKTQNDEQERRIMEYWARISETTPHGWMRSLARRRIALALKRYVGEAVQ